MKSLFSKFWNNLSSMSTGKKIYATMWLITGIVLIVIIALLVAWQKSTVQSDITVTATFGFIFLVSLIATVFTTVFVSMKEKKGGKK